MPGAMHLVCCAGSISVLSPRIACNPILALGGRTLSQGSRVVPSCPPRSVPKEKLLGCETEGNTQHWAAEEHRPKSCSGDTKQGSTQRRPKVTVPDIASEALAQNAPPSYTPAHSVTRGCPSRLKCARTVQAYSSHGASGVSREYIRETRPRHIKGVCAPRGMARCCRWPLITSIRLWLRSRSLPKPFRRDQTRSKRSRFITLVHAATKSFTNFSFESAHA